MAYRAIKQLIFKAYKIDGAELAKSCLKTGEKAGLIKKTGNDSERKWLKLVQTAAQPSVCTLAKTHVSHRRRSTTSK